MGGTASGVYCLLYAVAGALIGMSASVLLPDLAAGRRLPARRRGAAAGARRAGGRRRARRDHVDLQRRADRHRHRGRQDIVGKLRGRVARTDDEAGNAAGWWPGSASSSSPSRACSGRRRGVHRRLRHPRRRPAGGDPRRHDLEARHHHRCAAAIVVGTVATLVTMSVVGDIYANEPIYVRTRQQPRRLRRRQPGLRGRRPRRAGGMGHRAPARPGRFTEALTAPGRGR